MGADADGGLCGVCAATGGNGSGIRQCLDYGDVGQQPIVAGGFRLRDKDKIIGLMMVGTPTEEVHKPRIPIWKRLSAIGKRNLKQNAV